MSTGKQLPRFGLSDSKDEGTVILRNASDCSPVDKL